MGKSLKHAENYNIGLDIGTGSVGWAVTDENGNLYSFQRKPTWGSRLFPSADPASVARVPRGQRRRYERRRQRLNLLQSFFAESMEEVDPEFFIRLRQSRLLPEDRECGHADYRWPLFNGSDFTEKDYYEKYPTIYHLRAWLMDTDEKADLRLVYLALHNIVKTRGNFLHQDNPGLSAKNANMKEAVESLRDALELWCTEHDASVDMDVQGIQGVLEDGALRRKEKCEALVPLFGMGKEGKKRATEIAKAILGNKADFGKLLDIEVNGAKFDLANDESVEAFYSECPDDAVSLFEAIRATYSSHILVGILKGGNGQTISYCKIREYDRYGEDLRLLKSLVRKYVPSSYDEFFRGAHYSDSRWKKDYDPEKAQGYTRYNLGTSKRSYEDFKKDIEKLLAGTAAESDPQFEAMKQSLADGVFLRRLKTSDNGSIPYQLHLEEMRAIIENQGKYYPFLLEEQEKIESLVTFRIPYYVGPLTTKNARRVHDDPNGDMRFAWSVRLPGKENTPVLPWNWEEVIDKDKSAETFIRRMTGTCTYLQGEPVLPRCSLLYEKYCVLNELNGSRWTPDGDKEPRFCVQDRIRIFDELFKHGTVTYKKVENWLKQNGWKHPHVRGGQGEKKYESKLSSHIFFCKVLGVDDIDKSLEPMIEELILWNTLFEDRDILREKIKKAYGDRLTDDQIKQICKKRFSGWGRLSKKLLCELKANTSNGPMSIMDILEEGNPEGNHVGSAMVFMEILHDDHFGFESIIDAANLEKANEGNGLSVDDLPGSPALRRSVNQAMRIVEEIVSIAGKQPANIFIEVTRDDDKSKKGKRTTRRYDGLKEALKSLKEEGAELLSELTSIKPEQLDQRLSLYFMQNGRCLYSGRAIDIRRVMEGDEAYQVDHIIPRSYVKDDSFENLALVYSEENQRKANNMLLDESIRQKMRKEWETLHDAGLIGDKKYNNLMRSSISEKQMQGFINRQLVETSQIVKFVRLMLEQKYPDTEIESIKASLSHQLREEQGLVKCREANNFHHAHDALLAAEIGRFIQLRHPGLMKNPIGATHVMEEFISQRSEEYKKTHVMPGSATFIINSFLRPWFDPDTGEYWDAEAECKKLRRFLNFKQCFISRMPEITSGAFWDATIYSPKDARNKSLAAVKKNLSVSKYGGYKGRDYAFFAIFVMERGGKQTLELCGVPVDIASGSNLSMDKMKQYISRVAEEKGGSLVSVVRLPIYKKQLVEIAGCRLYLTALGEVRNGTEIAFSLKQTSILKDLLLEKDTDENDRVALFNYIVDRLPRVANRLSDNLKIEEVAGKFDSLPATDQRKLIIGLISIINANNRLVDLSALGKAKTAGQLKLTFSKVMMNSSMGLTLIDQSVTGMFERRQCIEL